MTSSIDAHAMRRMNRVSVFRKIFEEDRISRIEISRDLGMNKATVSSIVDDLIQNGFVNEIGYGESQGGRKPILLELNNTAAYIVSIDVQITHVTCAVLSLKGDIVWQTRHPLYNADIPSTKENLADNLEREIRSALTHVPDSPHGVLGAGIALPGMVNARTGYVHYLPNLEIHDWPIKIELAARLNMPIYIDNDANCGALAEYVSSKADNLAFVNAGIGVGLGIIANGRLYRGQDGIAGEYGHTTISAMGLRCSCGSYGCWEEYASERGLLRLLQDRGEEQNRRIPDPDFTSECITKAESGDENYIEGFSELGRNLGYGIANICNALNPGKIFLGGSLANAYSFVIESVTQVLSQRAVARNKFVEVVLASPGTVVRGASRLVLQEALFDPQSTLLDSTHSANTNFEWATEAHNK
ncbi:ROK family transcriptional regulator [Alicyclobacillus sp. SO9]|uniref:ROK family transcriptional regulator n=1 Tax=Alicyclobacillus sp. SO9 TaxID=2665646 RepID=UPI0018E8D0DC|nr:ROK family transcriptional regulator [Alicyclobacillus sp. SO9]QQE77934.1 ROK family transcriptional regulator [Alicyclobacillus sp. SO9]